ncbi:MAG: DUF2099 family protein [Candidatus Omnitrophica bacterium]|jgi:putative methanogenesis marker protein 8|nr:DUF2099 family protein [Candidatus Omnitrophota bacterium]MDD5725281.1 DUF2099 family protein [Candidatus Omnitrophota bacterium]
MPETAERDIHILKYFSSFISVSQGKVVNVTDPQLAFCPLAAHLYRGLKKSDRLDKEKVKKEIWKVIEFKIRDFGVFTARRKFFPEETAVPCGASEMLYSALKKKAIEAAVLVCDGAGTVITDRGEIAQGIGARMNSLLLTSPITAVMGRLERSGCRVVFRSALIDQVEGVREAFRAGHRKVAVTVSGKDSARLEEMRSLVPEGGTLVILSLCNTGVSAQEAKKICRHADIVWSCASAKLRKQAPDASILQLSKQAPVFILTGEGMDFLSAYVSEPAVLKELSRDEQYLLSNEPGGRKLKTGTMNYYLRRAELPVLSPKSFFTAGQ